MVDAYYTALKYVSNFDKIRNDRKNSLALLGKPGAGKTYLLTAIANRLLKKGVSVLYFPWAEGFNEIKNDLSSLETRIHHMSTVSVLFIDDLFKGRKEPTPFKLEQLFAIINYRYLNHLPILVSSEKDIDQICDYERGNWLPDLRNVQGLHRHPEGRQEPELSAGRWRVMASVRRLRRRSTSPGIT